MWVVYKPGIWILSPHRTEKGCDKFYNIVIALEIINRLTIIKTTIPSFTVDYYALQSMTLSVAIV